MKFFLAVISIFFVQALQAQPVVIAAKDSLQEEKIIEDVIVEKKAPKPEVVQYLTTTTRYGFKGLFNNRGYGYTPGLSYSAQIDGHASAFMDNYIQRNGKFLMGMKSWGQPYFNLIENVFAQYGVPKELKYLAVIESHLSTAATSWIGAGGPWQFMPYTARDYGLIVNSGYDERRDYTKSTHAAARYLLDLYRQMNRDWLLVIAAYNGGPGRVYSAINRSGSRNFWDLQYYLPEESRNHVKKFIATHYIMEGGQSYTAGSFAGVNAVTGEGIDGWTNATQYAVNNSTPNSYSSNKPKLTGEEISGIEIQNVSGKYIGSIIAQKVEMDIKEFNKFNPNFDKTLSGYGSYDLRLPVGKMQLFRAYKYDILNECVNTMLQSKVNYNTTTVYKKKKLKLK